MNDLGHEIVAPTANGESHVSTVHRRNSRSLTKRIKTENCDGASVGLA